MAAGAPMYNSAALDLDGVDKQHNGPVCDGNVLSRMTFWPATPIVSAGSKRPVQHADLWRLERHNQSGVIWQKFHRNWKLEEKDPKPSLFRAVRRTFMGTFFHAIFLQFLSALLNFVQPILLPFVLEYLSDLTQPAWYGYLYSACAVVASIMSAVLYYHATIGAWTLGLNIRSALSVLIYRKVLRLAPEKGRNSGDIINLISTDAQQILDTIAMFNQGVIGPLLMMIIIGLLYYNIGWYAFLCLGVLILSIPFDIVLGGKVGPYKDEAQKSTDSRVKLTRELLSAIRIVKSYAWERPFERNLMTTRDEEVRLILGSHKILAGLLFVITNVPNVAIAMTFSLYGWFGTLEVGRVWTAMSLFNLLRQPFIFLPISLSTGLQDAVSLGRIQEFMLRDELPKKPKSAATTNGDASHKSKKKDSDNIVVAKDADLNWNLKDTDSVPTLRDVSFQIKRSKLVMVVGRVGSGKSTLVQSVLGEVPLAKGSVETHAQVAYVPQEAWIVNGSLRDNILFGQPYDKTLYKRVLLAAALKTDLALMPAGDQSEIGDRGVNLSGGQRQRVSIARALYSNRDLYVFDDPLSALDSGVGAHVFEHAIQNFLHKQGKTVILVTNQLQYLAYADYILMLKGGKIVEEGTFEHLRDTGAEFQALSAEFGAIEKARPQEEMNENDLTSPALPMPRKSFGDDDDGPIVEILTANNASTNGKTAEEKNPEQALLGKLTGEEQREKGLIGFGVYWYYFKGGTLGMFVFVLLTGLLANASRVVATIWLSEWANDPTARDQHIWVFIGCSFGETFFLFFFLGSFVFFAAIASKSIHHKLLTGIIRASVFFFDVTPFGRLMSRFAKDLSLVDIVLPLQLVQYINMIYTLIALFALIVASQPIFLVPIVLILAGYWLLTNWYRKTSIEIQRLESLSRAPVFSHLSETIEGAVSIRAYGMTNAFKVANLNKIDANTVDFYALRYANMWLGIRLDWMGTFLLAVLFFGVMIMRNFFTIDASLAGVPMSSAVSLTFFFANLAMNNSETETRMNSVERLKQYTVVPQEAAEIVSDNRPAKDWPQTGEIKFQNLNVSYNKRDPVLRNITATIKPREKVGIVGRTGAGKSSLLTTLLRMVEPSDGSKIIIDGINILNIGLFDLRAKISIIPQAPTMFIGSIRYNLDPFSEHTDDELWKSLEMVQLKPYVSTLEGGLEAQVEENGQNFSVGQRQMLSMARALVRDSNILLLDEATASLDSESDALIQKMVRKYFASKTVITIAHRLHTIMDSDRVMVLDKGRLAEFDTPKNLVQLNGIFASMIEATGPASAEHLRAIANGKASVTENGSDEGKDKKKKKHKSKENGTTEVLEVKKKDKRKDKIVEEEILATSPMVSPPGPNSIELKTPTKNKGSDDE